MQLPNLVNIGGFEYGPQQVELRCNGYGPIWGGTTFNYKITIEKKANESNAPIALSHTVGKRKYTLKVGLYQSWFQALSRQLGSGWYLGDVIWTAHFMEGAGAPQGIANAGGGLLPIDYAFHTKGVEDESHDHKDGGLIVDNDFTTRYITKDDGTGPTVIGFDSADPFIATLLGGLQVG